MQALHNLCKVSKPRQAEAAAAGITPMLCQLATTLVPPTAAASRPRSTADAPTAARTRSLCITLLCALVHSNSKTRAELWQNQGLDLFVDLLPEAEWQRQALEALSVWLQEDTPRVEPKLLVKRNVGVVVEMFRGAERAQERLLRPLRDMLTCSPKLSTAFGTQARLARAPSCVPPFWREVACLQKCVPWGSAHLLGPCRASCRRYYWPSSRAPTRS